MGKALLEGYDSKGKDKVTVADELIDRAIEMGFLSEGGQVSFSIDSPDDALFQEYGTELRTKVTEHLDGRITITIEITNHQDGQGQESPENSSSSTPSLPAASQPESTLPSSSEPSRPGNVPPASSGSTDYDDTDYDLNDNNSTNYVPPSTSTPPADTDYDPAATGSRIIRTGIPIMIRITTIPMTMMTATAATTMTIMMIMRMTINFSKNFSSLPRFWGPVSVIYECKAKSQFKHHLRGAVNMKSRRKFFAAVSSLAIAFDSPSDRMRSAGAGRNSTERDGHSYVKRQSGNPDRIQPGWQSHRPDRPERRRKRHCGGLSGLYRKRLRAGPAGSDCRDQRGGLFCG